MIAERKPPMGGNGGGGSGCGLPGLLPSGSCLLCCCLCLWFWAGERLSVAAESAVAVATHPEPSCLWLMVTSAVVQD